MKSGKIVKLPDSEFQVMKSIWDNGSPIKTTEIISGLEDPMKWKAPTVISLLNRLIKKGFLRSEKIGKERAYYELISKDEYVSLETNNFMKQYHNSSIMNFVSAFTDSNTINEKELGELMKWAKEYKNEHE